MIHRTSSIYGQDDPISIALRPPPSESVDEQRARLQLEADARRRSDKIDEELRLERERIKREKKDVKLLLLGQAESGKSTLQKQFQLMYKPDSLESEQSSWRTVIYFNVIRSIKHILTTLEAWEDAWDDNNASDDVDDFASMSPFDDRHIANLPSPPSTHNSPSALHAPAAQTTQPQSSTKEIQPKLIAILRRRLSPLVAADTQLADRLSGGITVSGSGKGGVFVRSGWQTRTIENGLSMPRRPKRSADKDGKTEDPLVEDVCRMLYASKEDIAQLWHHPTVKILISKRKLKLDEWSEFFLDNIARVSSHNYKPTTDDILHARIQTMGVAEHVFDINIRGKEVMWHLFDVGGARGQRNSWVPFFDDANAIIFVAPISAFDQYLEEDPRTNRIDDSLQLFTQICSNVLLKHVHLVLFLNKTDILRAKLNKGVLVKKYITSYGNRPNEYDSVVSYFRAHFLQAHRRNNELRRVLYTHLTSVVDTKTTHTIIANVRDSIFRGHLQSAALV
jgi:guanine nucleotide-binding protein subunit alpha